MSDSHNVLDVDHPQGEELALPLECPKCNKLKWVHLRDLQKPAHCMCGHSFAVGPGGHLCATKNIQVRCPRCMEVVTLPEKTIYKEITCQSCYLTVPLPHKQAERRGYKSQRGSRHADARPKAAFGSGGGYSLPKLPWYAWAAAGSGAICVLGLLLWWSSTGTMDEQLARANQELMLATIQGESDTVEKWIDPRHGASYRLWVREYVRPRLQSAEVGRGTTMELDLKQRDPPLTWVQVTVKSSKDEARFSLAWKEAGEGKWQLDALKTASFAQEHSPRRRSGPRSLDVSF